MSRSKWIAGAAAAAAWLLTGAAQAFPGGTDQGASDCGPCHGNTAEPELVVMIDGPLALEPNEIATYTVSIPAVGAGGALDVVADGGATLAVVDGNTQLDNAEIVHVDSDTDAPAGNRGDWSYALDLIAPDAEGITTLTALMMAFNGDGDAEPGDIWNVASLEITVPEPTVGVSSMLAGLAVALAARLRRSGGFGS